VGASFSSKSAAAPTHKQHITKAATVESTPSSPSTSRNIEAVLLQRLFTTKTPIAMASSSSAPTGATDAVLKPSEPVPEGAQEVQGIDFNQYASRSITVEELVGGYANMGFQATSVGEAVRIINDMVGCFCPDYPNARAAACQRQVRRQHLRMPGISRPCTVPKDETFSLIWRRDTTVSRSLGFLLINNSAHGKTLRQMTPRRYSLDTRRT
jgi:hypothetical protein